MPTWLTAALTIGGMLFSAGITWGVFSYRQTRGEETQTTLVKELKDCVVKLQHLVTEVEVMKAANLRFERQTEDHDKRIGALEVTVAKIGHPARKRG